MISVDRLISHKKPGTYALILPAETPETIVIGKLGRLGVCRGNYLYVGSAFGPGGLAGRIRHHLRPLSSPHWHIDYLRKKLLPSAVWFTTDRRRREHQWAAIFAEADSAAIPLIGFGASDCRCDAHLFFFPAAATFNTMFRQIHQAIPDHAPIYHLNLQSQQLYQFEQAVGTKPIVKEYFC